MKYQLLHIFLKILGFVSRILPDKGREIMAHLLSWILGKVVKIDRQVARKNIKKSFPQLSLAEIETIIDNVYLNLVYTLIEFLISEVMADEGWENVYFENEDYLKKAYKKNQGVIIYTAHFGNWEWLPLILAARGYPVTAIARKQNSMINKEIEKIRQLTGVNIIYRGKASIRKSFKCLQNGECLYIVGDQDARGQGWKVNFFNRPASTYKGAVKLAAKTGAPIVPSFLIRQEKGKFKLLFKKPVYVDPNTDKKGQKEILQKLTHIYEEVITDHKSQWLWLYKRWRTY
ncbi:MAG: lysophospholipid acyltransferase family protein [Halanaerobiales bacterium]